MNTISSFSRRSLAWILFFMLLFSALCSLCALWLCWTVSGQLPPQVLESAASCSSAFAEGLENLVPLWNFLQTYGIFLMTATFFVLGLLLWLLLRRCLVRAVRREGLAGDQKAPGKAKKGRAKEKSEKGPAAEEQAPEQAGKKERKRENERFYLHLLSVLQRDGRLLDFLEEDLSLYDDAQIGAAVRSIQDNCKKVVNQSLSPKPVFDHAEGDTVTVPADFDPTAVKLTGNVSGEPPFTGTLRHRGWRAARLELPTLSSRQDPGVIAPAEVEIP
ncbi:MAG TPA: DUF2760 domain-containing protein [Desulfosalsimonadaceae bacterium]|nr:DUF2760 domain-containing protein [Desulfosalsimonadaceae bacterium]